jgi:hypothetical protein
MDPLMRFGSDILVAWDADNRQTDAYLKAAIEISRALCFRSSQNTTQQIDFEPIDRAVLAIEKAAQNLDKIKTSAETIRSSNEKILDRVRIDQIEFIKQIAVLRESMTSVKSHLGKTTESTAEN